MDSKKSLKAWQEKLSILCFHFPLSAVILGRKNTIWAAFDHHLVHELKNCKGLRTDLQI